MFWYCGRARLFNVRPVAFIGCKREGCCSNSVTTCSPRRNGQRLVASGIRASSPTGCAEGRRARLHQLVSLSLCLSSLSVCLLAFLSVWVWVWGRSALEGARFSILELSLAFSSLLEPSPSASKSPGLPWIFFEPCRERTPGDPGVDGSWC